MSTLTFFIVAGLVFFMLSCWAILDAAQKDFGSLGKKAAWMLVAAVPFVGFIVYFAIGCRLGKKPDPDANP
jgi:bacteriorhodopsin